MNRATILRAVAAAGLASWVTSVVAQTTVQSGPCGHGPYMMGWYSMWLGPLSMIFALAVVIAIAVLLVRWLSGPWHPLHPPGRSPQARAALDILKERYARGEIDKEEFEERRRVIGD